MTNLELLPDEYRPRGPVNLQNLLLMLLSLGLAFALIGITTRLIDKSQGYTTLLNDLRAQMIPYRKQHKDIQVAQEKLRVLEGRLPLIEDLIRQRILWSQRLADLNSTIPADGLWLDQISVQFPEEADVQPVFDPRTGEEIRTSTIQMPWLRITGWTEKLGRITEFFRDLQETPGFMSPVLLRSQEMEIENQMLINFECRVQLASRKQVPLASGEESTP